MDSCRLLAELLAWGTLSEGAGVAPRIDVGVLGRFQVTVGSEDITERIQPSQRAIVGLLAAAREPVAKADICRIVGVAPSSLDPQLSRLRTALGADKPVHRGRAPTSGFIALDREVVGTDVDEFRERVTAGAAAHARGDDRDGLPLLLAADNLWRGPVFDGLLLLDDPASQTNVKDLVETLMAERHRCRELAAGCWLAGTRQGLDSERLLRWAAELRDSVVCWSAATRAVLERDGTHAAALVAERGATASIDEDAAGSGMYGEVVRLLGGGHRPGPHPPAGPGDRAAAVGRDPPPARPLGRGRGRLLPPRPTRPWSTATSRPRPRWP